MRDFDKCLGVIWLSFKKNIFHSLCGFIFTTAATSILTIAVARNYGPDDFGYYSIFLSTVAVIIPISGFGLPLALVIANPILVPYILNLTFFIAMACAAVTLASITIVYLLFDIPIWLFFIPFIFLSGAALQSAEYKAARDFKFKEKSKSAIIASTISNLSKVLAILCSLSIYYIFILHILGLIINSELLRRSLGLRYLSVRLKRKSFLLVFRTYKDLILFRMPQTIVNTFSQSLPIYFLAYFSGSAEAGSYAFLRTMLALPSSLLGRAFSDAFYPTLYEKFAQGKSIRNDLLSYSIKLFMAAAPTYLLIYLISPVIIAELLGDKWNISRDHIGWISLWLTAGFSNRAVVASIPILNLERFFLKFEVLSLLIRALSLFIGFFWLPEVGPIALFSATGFIMNLLLIYICVWASKR